MLKAEDWLKENCKDSDWDKLTDENLSDFIHTSNVIKYMRDYSLYVIRSIQKKKINESDELCEDDKEALLDYIEFRKERYEKHGRKELS